MEIRVELKSVTPHPFAPQAIMVLQDVSSKTELEVYIGIAEGHLLHQLMQLKEMGHTAPRPGTYDLMKSIAEKGDMKPVKVVITEIVDGAFISSIHFEKDGHGIAIDARPSNSVPFAMSADIPIFVEDAVLDEAGKAPSEEHDCEMCSLPCSEKDEDADE